MTEAKHKEAQEIKREINELRSALELIKFTSSQNYPPRITIQGMTNNARINNEVLNKKLESTIIEFCENEIIKLQKKFDEL